MRALTRPSVPTTNVAGIGTADYLAKWNGSAWSAVSAGQAIDAAALAAAKALRVDNLTDAEAITLADRILVLSARPGTVRSEHRFDVPHEARDAIRSAAATTSTGEIVG